MTDNLKIPHKPKPDHLTFDHPERVNKSGNEVSMPTVFEITNTTRQAITIDFLNKQYPEGLSVEYRNEFPEIIDFDEILSERALYEYCIGLVVIQSTMEQKENRMSLYVKSDLTPYYLVCPGLPSYKKGFETLPRQIPVDFWLTGDGTQSLKYEINPETFVSVKIYPAMRKLKTPNNSYE